MLRLAVPVFAVCVLASSAAWAQQWSAAYPPPGTPRMVVVAPPPPPMRNDLGGGFIEFLFGNGGGRQPIVMAPPPVVSPQPQQPEYIGFPPVGQAPVDPMLEQRPPNFRMDSRFLPHEVAYQRNEAPGTIVVDTAHHFLYLVEGGGRARRYGIGVARDGFSWSGAHKITAKKEWPDWIPPKEMLERQPYLPRRMAGGPGNPLGARALYIGSTLYRIHGTSEPWTIGGNVSSGCIRMRNVDVIDLYQRVGIGNKVVVLGPNGSDRDDIPTSSNQPRLLPGAG